jgi:Bacterial regulatory proteins, tetR family
MSAWKAMVLTVGLLLAATPASAIYGLEFLQADDKNIFDARDILQPVIRQFIQEGYHNVPDWLVLRDATRALILERGYRDKDIAEIAKEAAIAKGMSK